MAKAQIFGVGVEGGVGWGAYTFEHVMAYLLLTRSFLCLLALWVHILHADFVEGGLSQCPNEEASYLVRKDNIKPPRAQIPGVAHHL